MNNAIGLFDSLTQDHIAVNINALSWEEAVDCSGRLMVDTGLTQISYIEAMINTIKSIGPYCVIAPGIAMPHARPGNGVIQTGFSLITLEQAVEFGNKTNDPVDIVIGLAALDKETHITALKEIAICFSDDTFNHNLRAAKTKKDVLNLLNSKRKET